jgi:hypothetical protein
LGGEEVYVDLLKFIQEAFPWARDLPAAPKVVLTFIVLALSAFVLLLLWSPTRRFPDRKFVGWRATLYKNDVRVRDLYQQLPGPSRIQGTSAHEELRELIDVAQKEGLAISLESQPDWANVKPGALVLFHGTFALDSGGLTQEELYSTRSDQSHPLRLRGQVGGRSVDVLFSSKNLVSSTVISILFQPPPIEIRGAALVTSLGNTASPAVLEPIEFGS